MVEIIPKPKKEIPLLQNILLYFFIALLIGTLSYLFVLNKEKTKSSQTLDDLKESLLKEKTPEEKVLEKEVLASQKIIEDFTPLFENRKLASHIFLLFEKTCHPKVFFSSFSLNVPEEKLTLVGASDNFLTLEQHLLIFRKEQLIKDVNLIGLSLSKEGKVNFTFEIFLAPKIFLQNL